MFEKLSWAAWHLLAKFETSNLFFLTPSPVTGLSAELLWHAGTTLPLPCINPRPRLRFSRPGVYDPRLAHYPLTLNQPLFTLAKVQLFVLTHLQGVV